MRTLLAMREPLDRASETDEERLRAHRSGREAALSLATALPLVHRTRGTNLGKILTAGNLVANTPCTLHERECGIPRALYFFFGCVAYPEGTVAFVVPNRVLRHSAATYTPFDSGSLDHYARPRSSTDPWGPDERRLFLESHLGEGPDVASFASDYIAAHFRQARDYVSRPQESAPDFPTYHGLESTTGDRRAWSLEVQLHEDLELTPENIDAIALAEADRIADIPDALKGRVLVAEDEGSLVIIVQQYIAPEPTP